VLTPEEQKLRQDAIRLTRRNDTILNVITRLEAALEENEELKDRIVGLEGVLREYADINNWTYELEPGFQADQPTYWLGVETDERYCAGPLLAKEALGIDLDEEEDANS
jgi:hypothetical protein